MQKAYLHFIKYALAQGYRVDVDTLGDPDEIETDLTYSQAKDAVESVGCAWINVIDRDTGKRVGAGFAIPFDVGGTPEETIADGISNAFFDAWDAAYQQDGGAAH